MCRWVQSKCASRVQISISIYFSKTMNMMHINVLLWKNVPCSKTQEKDEQKKPYISESNGKCIPFMDMEPFSIYINSVETGVWVVSLCVYCISNIINFKWDTNEHQVHNTYTITGINTGILEDVHPHNTPFGFVVWTHVDCSWNAMHRISNIAFVSHSRIICLL